ncbi:MAG TPA: hypothetical protein VNO31_16655 [Umezawaea sp.]|nr:hypothetical protein [Umezawaea sp.]
MKKTLIGFGAATVMAAGIAVTVATNAFGYLGDDIRMEVNGSGKSTEIAVAWPGQFDPVAVAKDTTLPWSDSKNKRDGVAIIVANGVADDTTCRILVNDKEVATGTAKDGRLGCSTSAKNDY